MSRVHFIGVGGVGMSAIARVMLARGTHVSGSDAKESPTLADLRRLGAVVHVGHAAAHVEGAGTVVASAAVRESNPELVAARAAGIPVQRRADALAGLLDGYVAIAVAGTHGKSTTTSMLTVALQHCGADPSYAIGADLPGGAGNGHHGSGELFVVEADESDGSFLAYHPHAAVVTNVEADHLDHHGTVEAYEQAFRDFAATVTGFLVVCLDDPGAADLAAQARAAGSDVRTYGKASAADLQLRSLHTGSEGSSFEAVLRGTSLGLVTLGVPGEHMARNSAGALLMAVELGMPAQQVISGLAAYSGVRRRMELLGTAVGVRVYDDYAHHPTEIRAQLLAARETASGGRVIAVFQPHLYSRTRAFAEDFAAALSLADAVLVMDVYGAREEPIAGVSGALIADKIPAAVFEPDRSKVAPWAASRCVAGDLVVTLGAGDVTEIGPQILSLLEATA